MTVAAADAYLRRAEASRFGWIDQDAERVRRRNTLAEWSARVLALSPESLTDRQSALLERAQEAVRASKVLDGSDDDVETMWSSLRHLADSFVATYHTRIPGTNSPQG